MLKKGKISLMLGVAAGALTGLLFAPTKGKELREKISKEREDGGLGHKAIATELARMADEITAMAQDVAKSEEAKQFWKKTTDTVDELSKGTVDLDVWVSEAHKKADLLKKAATKYATEKKKYLRGAKKVVKKAANAVKEELPKKKTTPKKKTPSKKAPLASKKKITPKKK